MDDAVTNTVIDECQTIEDALDNASILFEQHKHAAEEEIRRCLQKAEALLSEEYDTEHVVPIAKAWMKLQGYFDGEKQSLRVLCKIDTTGDTIEGLVDYARTCIEVVGEAARPRVRITLIASRLGTDLLSEL